MVHGGRRAIMGAALVALALTCGACVNEPVTPIGSAAAPGAGDRPAPSAPAPGQPTVPPGPSAPPEPTGPPTLFGRVVDVPDPVTAVVEVQGTRIPVSVLGLDPTSVPACARADALAFARETLQGEDVTLVPDPTLPESSPRRSYVVLTTQLSYTDALIQEGWAAPAGPALYRPVFDTERAAAEAEGIGRWGPPCVPAG